MMAVGLPAILCADIGTSSLKAALVGYDGEAFAYVREPYPADRVLNGSVLASDWANAFQKAAITLAERAKHSGLRLSALCLSGNGPTLIPVFSDGSDGEPLHWHDGGIEPPKKAAKGKTPSLFLPKAAWYKRNQKSAYDRIRFFLSSHEWLAYRLGAAPRAILPNQDYAPYYWDKNQLAAFDIDEALFPPFAITGEIIGELSAEAARSAGLPPKLPIIAGGPDFAMALIGTATLREGAVCDRAGTSEGINVCARSPSRSTKLRSLPHPSPGFWNIAALLPITGRLFEWYRTITGQAERDYDAIMDEIALSKIDYPSTQAFSGEDEVKIDADVAGVKRQAKKACPAATGYFFPDFNAIGGLGASGAFLATAGFTSRAEFGRATVEAIGFMVRAAVEELERHGYRVEGMRLSGGQAKNTAWNHLKADITGRCLLVPRIADGELSGNAAAALLSLGEADSLEEAADRVVHIETVYEPNQRTYAQFSEKYDQYRYLLKKMERFFQ